MDKIKLNTSTVLLLTFFCVLFLTPGLIFKGALFDNTKKLQKIKKDFSDVQTNTASISKLAEDPDAFGNFVQNAGKKKELLLRAKPTAIEMITAQKMLAGFAKSSNVAILSLRPISSTEPLVLEKADPEEEGAKDRTAKGLLVALIEIQIRGYYANVCQYIESIENSQEATLAIDVFHLNNAGPDYEDMVGANLNVRLYYSTE